jgi:hypothetical protein
MMAQALDGSGQRGERPAALARHDRRRLCRRHS